MQDSSIDKMIEAGLASRASFNAQLTQLFIDYKTSEKGISPVALLEKINSRIAALPGLDTFQDLTTMLAVQSLNDPSATFEYAKSRLGRTKYNDTRLALEHMKSEVLASMLRFVIKNPVSEKSQAIVDALYQHGSEKDRAILSSIGKKSQAEGVLNQTWQAVSGMLSGSQAANPIQIEKNKQSKSKEMATLLAGIPNEGTNIKAALEPLINRHGYTLSIQAPGEKPEAKTIYLEKHDKSSFKYTLIDPQGKKQEKIVTMGQLIGEGTDSEKFNREKRLKEILRKPLEQNTCELEVLPGILKFAIEAGHAHIDLSFIDTLQNDELKRQINATKEIKRDLFEIINTPESLENIRHHDLPIIAAHLETLAVYILTTQRMIVAAGDTLSSDQKAALYRQLDTLNGALLTAQNKVVDSMMQRLRLLDPNVLKNIDTFDPEKMHLCAAKNLEELAKNHWGQDFLQEAPHINNLNIIKYLLYIGKVGTNEQRLEVYQPLPDKVKLSKEHINQWLETKLKEWGVKFNEEEKKF